MSDNRVELTGVTNIDVADVMTSDGMNAKAMELADKISAELEARQHPAAKAILDKDLDTAESLAAIGKPVPADVAMRMIAAVRGATMVIRPMDGTPVAELRSPSADR